LQWTIHFYLSRNVWAHHLKIRNLIGGYFPYAPNADGIDADSTSDVIIEHNDISVGDDHIAIKSGLSDDTHTTARLLQKWLS